MSSSAPEAQIVESWQRTLYIMSFAHMVTAVGFSSIFPFLPLYVKSLGASTSISIEVLVGMVFSGQAASMMIASPIWGALADRWGRKIMVERATFGGALIMIMMAFVRSAEELVLLRILQGMITGTIGAANALVASIVPRKRAGYAMGMLQVALGCGFGVGPIIGGVVADTYGYRAAFYVTSGLLALSGVIVYFGVQERFVTVHSGVKRSNGLYKEMRIVLSLPGIAVAYSLRFINQLGRTVFIPILPLFLHGLIVYPDQVNSLTGIIIGVSSAATAVFAVYLGRLGDRIGHRRILIYSSFSSVGFFVMQSAVTAAWQLLVLQAFFGISIGGIVPGVSALLADYSQQGTEGAVYGLDNSIVSGARAIGPMIGVCVAMWIGYRSVFIAAALLYLAAGILAAVALPRNLEAPEQNAM